MISRNNSFDNLQNSRMRRRYDQNEISSVLEKAINLDNWSRSFPIWGYQRNVSRWITAVFGRKSVSKCTIWVLRERDASNENKRNQRKKYSRYECFCTKSRVLHSKINVKLFVHRYKSRLQNRAGRFCGWNWSWVSWGTFWIHQSTTSSPFRVEVE